MGRCTNPSYNVPSNQYTHKYVWTINNTNETPKTSNLNQYKHSTTNCKPIYLVSFSNSTNKSKISRRKSQRKKRRLLSTLTRWNQQATEWFLHHKTIQIKHNFGFISDPNKKLHINFQEAIRKLDTYHIIDTNVKQSKTNKTNLIRLQPKNLSMHNLCKEKQLPLGTKNLLGLGLKFCTAPTIPSPNIRETLQKLAYKIRTNIILNQPTAMR